MESEIRKSGCQTLLSFRNDGNPHWEIGCVGIKIKLRSESNWEEDDKMDYVLKNRQEHTGLDPDCYIEYEYSTAQEML
jgi:hypothetical protein